LPGMNMERSRVETGVTGLDQMLNGGLLEGSTTIVRGASGTGKTTLGIQFLYSGIVQKDEPGLLITFEEFPHSLHRDALSLGWDLKKLEAQDRLRIIFTSPAVFLSNLQSPSSALNQTIQEWGVKRVILDSITHFTRLSSDPIKLREIYNHVINGLKREGVTTVVTSEDKATSLAFRERGALSFLVDTVIIMRYVEIESTMQRAILILKMRGSAHDREIRRFEIKPGGIAIGDRFEAREGLLTGSPRRVAI
jgi:circadian clock protein KaiC